MRHALKIVAEQIEILTDWLETIEYPTIEMILEIMDRHEAQKFTMEKTESGDYDIFITYEDGEKTWQTVRREEPKEEEPEEEPEEITVIAARGEPVVRYGAFKNKESAEQLRDQLIENRYQAEIQEDGELYTIRVQKDPIILFGETFGDLLESILTDI